MRRRIQNIAFLRNHTQDIPDIWAKYKQVQNIPGIDAILKNMITAPLNKDGSPNPTYRGSYFQLNWVVNRQTTVGDIVRVEQYVNTPHAKITVAAKQENGPIVWFVVPDNIVHRLW